VCSVDAGCVFVAVLCCVASCLLSLRLLECFSFVFRQSQQFRVMMNRWQTATNFVVNSSSLLELSDFCDEFLVHSTSSDGTCRGPLLFLNTRCSPREAAFFIYSAGPNTPLLVELAKACQDHDLRITYAGGIATQAHIQETKRAGAGVVDFTIGTALSIFGGHLSLDEVISACN
jgi:phosphoribosylformimino-5-aminoimidazole carboxamide ribotide isomerase